MKTKSSLLISGLCSLLVSAAWAANSPTKPAAATPAPATTSSAASKPSTPSAAENDKPAASRSESADTTSTDDSKAMEAAKRAHIRPTRNHVKVETPPPPVPEETKPAQPAQGLVWVPGHWTPTKGEWQWAAGEWGIPATPVSVWIEPKYDPQTKEWTAGYWQPDRAEPYSGETPQEAPHEETAATTKF
jgi:hypothetical protein